MPFLELDLIDAHTQLSTTLRDTHYGYHVQVLQEPPTSVPFAKSVGLGIPFLVKGAAKDWPAVRKDSGRRWTNTYLREILIDEDVTVSVTGDGYADAVRWLAHEHGCTNENSSDVVNGSDAVGAGEFVFATPFELRLPFASVMDYLTSTTPCSAKPLEQARPVAFCQLQNDCLRGPEYRALLADVPDVIPSWAAPVLGSTPEAVNFWMGTHASVTTMHSDPFDNIYTVIRGSKTFTLHPPCDAFFLCKANFPTASWRPRADDNAASGTVIPTVELVHTPDVSPSSIPWIPITHPNKVAPAYPRYASVPPPFRVCVEAGDQLYLPRSWLHHVEQAEDEDGVCIAVNAWYEGWEGMGLNWGWTEYATRMNELLLASKP